MAGRVKSILMSNSTLNCSITMTSSPVAMVSSSLTSRWFSLLFLCCYVVDRSVIPVEFVAHLGLGFGSGGFRDQVNEGAEEGSGSNERIEHESRGKDQALSFCQRLIQLWLRSRLKHKYF
jgi:hypothetical protein